MLKGVFNEGLWLLPQAHGDVMDWIGWCAISSEQAN